MWRKLKIFSAVFSIKIPSHVLQWNQITLVVAAVIEQRDQKQVTWHLETLKGFLRDNDEIESSLFNPLHINIDRSELTNEGIYK